MKLITTGLAAALTQSDAVAMGQSTGIAAGANATSILPGESLINPWPSGSTLTPNSPFGTGTRRCA